MSTENNKLHLLTQITGGFLCLVGLGFITLLVALKLGGWLAGDLKVSAFLLAAGVLLASIGGGWLLSKPEPSGADQRYNLDGLDRFLLRLRRPAEVVAAAGSILFFSIGVAVFAGWTWPSGPVLSSLLLGPIVIGLFTLRILIPGAFQSGLFPGGVVEGWSAAGRICVNALLRLGWLGYLAIFSAWPALDALTPPKWRAIKEGLSSILIGLLYASQVLVLHIGRLRIVSGA